MGAQVPGMRSFCFKSSQKVATGPHQGNVIPRKSDVTCCFFLFLEFLVILNVIENELRLVMSIVGRPRM